MFVFQNELVSKKQQQLHLSDLAFWHPRISVPHNLIRAIISIDFLLLKLYFSGKNTVAAIVSNLLWILSL